MKHQMKFVLSDRKESKWGLGTSMWTLVFTAQYDESIAEDRKFNEATPSGRFEVTVKPSVAQEYELGKAYYFYSDETEKA